MKIDTETTDAIIRHLQCSVANTYRNPEGPYTCLADLSPAAMNQSFLQYESGFRNGIRQALLLVGIPRDNVYGMNRTAYKEGRAEAARDKERDEIETTTRPATS